MDKRNGRSFKETTALDLIETFEYPPVYGHAVPLTPLVRLLLCPNPSPMTFHGTNTYVVGTQDLAIIDPGPEDANHLSAILSSLMPGQKITHIIVTHSHKDHSPLAKELSARTQAPVYAFGDATSGRSPVMKHLAQNGLAGGGEGIDHGFQPDHVVADGDCIAGSDWGLDVIHTPGHLGNHISLALGSLCFTGDHVMGWSSSLVSPPDGDLTDFMASCALLLNRTWDAFLPGHGAPVLSPNTRLQELVAHRRAREAAILDQLALGAATVAELTAAIYVETPTHLLPAAERNVFAHLIDLHQQKQVRSTSELSSESRFERRE